MNRTKLVLCALAVAGATLNLTSCMDKNKNPFFSEYKTPHATAPFHKIMLEHYEPALMEGIKQHEAEVQAIINNPEAPTFENTIVALDYAGSMLDRVTTVFFNLNSAETSDEMQALAQKLSPVLTEHSNNISLNEKLFARVKAVYETADRSTLSTEQQRLLQKSYDGFARNGAEVMALISNDGWWGNTTGHKRLFDFCRLRAIETRRAIARSANTGISGFISPTGKTIGDRLEWDEQGVLTAEVELRSDKTVYTIYGDWIARISTFVAVLTLLYFVAYRIRKRNHLVD